MKWLYLVLALISAVCWLACLHILHEGVSLHSVPGRLLGILTLRDLNLAAVAAVAVFWGAGRRWGTLRVCTSTWTPVAAVVAGLCVAGYQWWIIRRGCSATEAQADPVYYIGITLMAPMAYLTIWFVQCWGALISHSPNTVQS